MKFGSHLLSGALLALVGSASGESLPQVDLGYEIHEALSYNNQTGLYTFSNIRYAQAPVGNLRFKAPVAPTGRNTEVQRGAEPRVCPQGSPSWGVASSEYGTRWLAGNLTGFNFTELHAQELPILKAVSNLLLQTPGLSEDCLFLDVIVPKKVFDNGKKGKKVPVLVWLPGGGYVLGHKADTQTSGDPAGSIAASQADGSDGIIVVRVNYRLGAFGWLAGPSLLAAGGIPNAGLHDQRLAYDWVQKNIHLFGGDAKDVATGGLSAGGGSIIHHLTAYGGLTPAPFKRAFINSPGFIPIMTNAEAEIITQDFLKYLNVSTLQQARSLPTEKLIRANADHILSSETSFVYGPVVDGTYVPLLPAKLLQHGLFNHKAEILISHMTYEGGTYVAPYVESDEDFRSYLNTVQPTMSDTEINKLIEFYPQTDGSRTLHWLGDWVFSCHSDWAARAKDGKAWVYEFGVQPAFHSHDLRWTFNGGAAPSYGNPPISPQVDQLQSYLANFVKKGDPNGAGLPNFPQYGKKAVKLSNYIKADGISTAAASAANERCRWMQETLYS